MDGLLTTCPSGLRVHQLGVGRVLVVLDLLCDELVALVLALQKGLLVGQEFSLCAASFTVPLVGRGPKAALRGFLGVFDLLNTLLLKLELTILLPVVESSNVFHGSLFADQFFLSICKYGGTVRLRIVNKEVRNC